MSFRIEKMVAEFRTGLSEKVIGLHRRKLSGRTLSVEPIVSQRAVEDGSHRNEEEGSPDEELMLPGDVPGGTTRLPWSVHAGY